MILVTLGLTILGSGWLLGIGAGLASAMLAIGLFPVAMASRFAAVRVATLALYAVPPMLAGGSTTRALALETGADGAWAVIAAVIGGAVFGATAIRRLAELAPEQWATIHPTHPPTHRVSMRRGETMKRKWWRSSEQRETKPASSAASDVASNMRALSPSRMTPSRFR